MLKSNILSPLYLIPLNTDELTMSEWKEHFHAGMRSSYTLLDPPTLYPAVVKIFVYKAGKYPLFQIKHYVALNMQSSQQSI